MITHTLFARGAKDPTQNVLSSYHVQHLVFACISYFGVTRHKWVRVL